MSESAIIKLYQLSSKYSDTELVGHLTGECKYSSFELDSRIQNKKDIFVSAFKKPNHSTPDWYGLLKPYQLSKKDLDFSSWDMVTVISHVHISGNTYHFLLTGGRGYHDVFKYLDYGFGLELLERVFDPEANKIDSVSDRGIVGEVLASIRFYRKGRHFAGEEDFGKYFQKIHVRLHESQVELFFPSLKAKQRKNHNQIIITGSACLEIRRKEPFSVIIEVVKSVSSLLETPPIPIFNKTLLVLTRNKDSELIKVLNTVIYSEIADAIQNSTKVAIECDFCHRDFEEFFRASELVLSFPSLQVEAPRKDTIGQLTFDDFSELSNMGIIDALGETLRNSAEYKTALDKKEFLDEFLADSRIRTIDDSGNTTTEGSLIEYLQAERRHDGKSYFLLDTNWFVLLPDFDASLTDKFKAKVAKKVKRPPFMPTWNDGDSEDEFNKCFQDLPNAFFLHKVFSTNVELCDAIYYDAAIKKIFIIHAKDGVGAQMRDLTSQTFLSARIIEEEVRTGKTTNIDKLYTLAVTMKRVDSTRCSIEMFRKLFLENDHEYCLVVKGQKGLDQAKVQKGEFTSRIAKFSLYEFSAGMAVNEWPFSICIL